MSYATAMTMTVVEEPEGLELEAQLIAQPDEDGPIHLVETDFVITRGPRKGQRATKVHFGALRPMLMAGLTENWSIVELPRRMRTTGDDGNTEWTTFSIHTLITSNRFGQRAYWLDPTTGQEMMGRVFEKGSNWTFIGPNKATPAPIVNPGSVLGNGFGASYPTPQYCALQGVSFDAEPKNSLEEGAYQIGIAMAQGHYGQWVVPALKEILSLGFDKLPALGDTSILEALGLMAASETESPRRIVFFCAAGAKQILPFMAEGMKVSSPLCEIGSNMVNVPGKGPGGRKFNTRTYRENKGLVWAWLTIVENAAKNNIALSDIKVMAL